MLDGKPGSVEGSYPYGFVGVKRFLSEFPLYILFKIYGV